jgi:hypothetical protein
VEFEGKPYIVYKDLWEKLVLLKATVNAAMFAGRQSASSFGEATFLAPLDPYTSTYPTSFTGGLYQYIANYGKTASVATTGTFAPAVDQVTITQNLLAAKSPKSLLVYCGSLASAVIDTGLKNLGSAGVTSVRLIIDGKDVDMEVDKWNYGGFNFRKVLMGILDSQEQFVNTVYPKYAYLVPDGKAKVEGGDGYVPRLSVRYFRSQVARNQGDDIWEEWHTGALAPTGATSDEKLWRANFDTIQGLEGLGMAQSMAMRILT